MVGFLTADVITETQQLWILLVLCLLTFISYTMLAKLTQKREDLFPCCFHATVNSSAATNGRIPEEVEGTVTHSSAQDPAELPSDQTIGVVNKLFNRKFSLDLSIWNVSSPQ